MGGAGSIWLYVGWEFQVGFGGMFDLGGSCRHGMAVNWAGVVGIFR